MSELFTFMTFIFFLVKLVHLFHSAECEVQDEYDSASTILIKYQREKKREESPIMASAFSSVISSFSYRFPSQEPIFSSRKVSSFTGTGRRVFGSINAVQGNPRRRTQNVEGDIFVDNTCIDCDTCRWMVPEVFTRVDNMSAVVKQPISKEERLNALQALLSCPTGSIRTETPPTDIGEAQETFPLAVDKDTLPGVFHCGFHSKKSYGATSYLILHPEGNIMVDSPRYIEKLARKIEMMGGIRYMFLTHRDDVADHKKWAARFKSTRILHSEDVEPSTSDVELKLEGSGPWSLHEDVELIHTPGHSEGSVCLFHKPLKALFTGDHLIMTESGLSILEQYNHGSVPRQLENVEKLINLDFNWLIPGHGRRAHFKDGAERAKNLEALVQKHREKQLVSFSKSRNA